MQLLENTSYMEGNYMWAASNYYLLVMPVITFFPLKIDWLIFTGKLAVCYCLLIEFAVNRFLQYHLVSNTLF